MNLKIHMYNGVVDHIEGLPDNATYEIIEHKSLDLNKPKVMYTKIDTDPFANIDNFK